MALVNEATGARYEVAEGEHTVGRGPWLQARHRSSRIYLHSIFTSVDYGQKGVERPRRVTCRKGLAGIVSRKWDACVFSR